jgi:histidyl-tRNA synthetase
LEIKLDDTKFGPPKGMRDWLPKETLLRQKLIRLIESHYQLYGFQPIDTPALENIEVLQGKGGGESEKLMFKILKRGEDLENELSPFEKLETLLGFLDRKEEKVSLDSYEKIWVENAKREIRKIISEDKLVDMGCRYDLTVPLARYVANHYNDLPKPFRCYHIGPVWRADRPQKGRFREFYQCDIDIVGGASDAYEAELLLATDRVLRELKVGEFKIRISDKRLLPDILTGMGVDANGVAKIAVAIDKLDKQPLEEVWKEIESLGHSLEVLNKVDSFLKNALHKKLDPAHIKIGQAVDLWKKIEAIRLKVLEVNPKANIVFDPLLVRGLDYYTGPVFEINVEDKNFSYSIGGGGRYDGLIEKLGGPKGTPAVGISLGFERILAILLEKEKSASRAMNACVYIASNGQTEKEILSLAESLRSKGLKVEACLELKKDFGKQMKAAQDSGMEYAIIEFKPGSDKLKVRRLSTRQDLEMTPAELQEAVQKLAETTPR